MLTSCCRWAVVIACSVAFSTSTFHAQKTAISSQTTVRTMQFLAQVSF